MVSVMKNRPDVWSQVDRLESHLYARREEEKWSFVSQHVVPLVVEQCGVKVEPELIERMVGRGKW